jgi:mono/diheme cytochrome c family protein
VRVNGRHLVLGLGLMTLAAGCHTDMWVMPRAKVQGESTFFADKMDSRPKVTGTVARGQEMTDEGYETGYMNGKLVETIPASQAMGALKIKTFKELIERGKERYDIFCSHCHGAIGDGNGMIAQRGLTLRRPVGNYHTDRLRQMQDGHFVDVIGKGYGVMKPLGYAVPVEDRWAITAFIRAMQRSQAPDAKIGYQKQTFAPVSRPAPATQVNP